jgi:hypothetical protein
MSKKNKAIPKGFIAVMKHESSSDPYLAFRPTYEEAVDEVHEHFLSYDFEIRDGKAYDPGHEDDRPGKESEPFDCFDQVKYHNGKVSQYWHCNGDGPEAWIQENK